MFHAVFFFIATCEFVLLDALLHVVLYVGRNYESVLCMAVHGLGVDVVVLFPVLYEPPVMLECIEVGYRTVVYLWVVLVGARLEVYFRLYYMVK